MADQDVYATIDSIEMTKDTIENWFHLYADDLYGWAFHKTSSKEMAEDLVQETFLSAVKGLQNFKNNSKPKTWLFAILNNKIIDYYRKKAKSTVVEHIGAEQKFINQATSFFDADENWIGTENEVAWEDDVHLLDNKEFNKTLDHCLNQLPDHWRFALVSKYLSDKTTNEICQEMGVTQSNYWQIVHRAKVLLKKCIDHKWVP